MTIYMLTKKSNEEDIPMVRRAMRKTSLGDVNGGGRARVLHKGLSGEVTFELPFR